MYYRELQNQLLTLSQKWSVISVTGPRQSGKTTLCKITFPNYEYYNLEDLPTRQHIAQNPAAFLRAREAGVIIDEAQLLPELFSAVQVVVDEEKSRRIVLSGSSDFLLMQGITQSLAGRVAVLRLLPLSISELGNAPVSTAELMYKGGFPSIWGDGKEVGSVMESYLTTYVECDVRQFINIKNIELFRKFITLCATRIGSEFNAQSLSNDLGASVVTVKEWIRILQASYIIYELPPFFRNIGKRLIKTPKIYFYDTGLVCYLLGVESAPQLDRHPLKGNIFENLIVTEMIKSRFNKGLRSNLFYYRDKGQHEIDVIQEFGNELRAYEIKSATVISDDFFRNMKYLRSLLPEEVISSQVIYDGVQESREPHNGYLNFRHWKEDNPWANPPAGI